MGQPLIPDQLTGWRGEWGGLRVVVAGLGEVGFSVADTMCELGARVLVVAPEASQEHRELLEVIGAELVLAVPEFEIPDAVIAFDAELCVVPAGADYPGAVYPWIADLPAPVWGDVELAWRLRDKVGEARPMEWLCVAGQGAEEISELTARMLVAGGVRAAPAGGAGVAAIDAIRDPSGFDFLIVALGGADLRSLPRLAPLAGACISVAGDEDDLAIHGGAFANNQVACVYGLADEATLHLVEDAEVEEGCRAIGVGLGVPGPSELGIVEDFLVDRAFLEERRTSALELATLDDLRFAGLDSPAAVTRVLAAAALARAAGAPPGAIREALRTFPTHPRG